MYENIVPYSKPAVFLTLPAPSLSQELFWNQKNYKELLSIFFLFSFLNFCTLYPKGLLNIDSLHEIKKKYYLNRRISSQSYRGGCIVCPKSLDQIHLVTYYT